MVEYGRVFVVEYGRVLKFEHGIGARDIQRCHGQPIAAKVQRWIRSQYSSDSYMT